VAGGEGVMQLLTNDPETLQMIQQNPEARDAFVNAYRQELQQQGGGYQPSYDSAAPAGYGGGQYQPGAAMQAIAQPVMPGNVANVLNQSPQFFQELALADGFDPRNFGGGLEPVVYA
jgi:hypothetical protein